jgi:hypothetical protein
LNARLDFKGESAPISIQIAGSEADELALSAQKAVALTTLEILIDIDQF